MNTPEITQKLFNKESPDKSTGTWCMDCGDAMRHNVPRMGPEGGWVHKSTGSLLCGPRKEVQWTVSSDTNYLATEELKERCARLERLVFEKNDALFHAESWCKDRADEIRDGAEGLTALPEGFWRDAERMMRRALELEIKK